MEAKIRIYREDYIAKYKNIYDSSVDMTSPPMFTHLLEDILQAVSSDKQQLTSFNAFTSILFSSVLSLQRKYENEIQVLKTKYENKVQSLKSNYEYEIQSLLKGHQHESEKAAITITSLQERVEESQYLFFPLISALNRDMVLPRGVKIGSVTRAEAFKELQARGGVRESSELIRVQNNKKRQELKDTLEKYRDTIQSDYLDETDMYLPIVQAMNDALYPNNSAPLTAHGTLKKLEFPADISVTSLPDESLPCAVRYFVQVKSPLSAGLLRSNKHGGQMLDYFNILKARQAYRLNFVAILTNYHAAWVYSAEYESETLDPPTISIQKANCLADAVIYADETSKVQFTENRLPILDERFGNKYSVIVMQKKHTFLSVPIPTNKPAAATSMRNMTRNNIQNNIDRWLSPMQYKSEKRFVLKASNSASLEPEIRVLKLIRENLQATRNIHVPELVWCTFSNDQLGIVPFGRPINLDHGETAKTCRNIVNGLMDGLWFLHGLNIIHRDIRLSNLILVEDAQGGNIVIIDYEAAVTSSSPTTYEGGLICCPRQLVDDYLEHEEGYELFEELYVPQKKDDLFASVLVALHILFPTWFERFPDCQIGMDQSYTLQLQGLWNSVTDSVIWGKYVRAIQQANEERLDKCLYDTLKEMGDVFCFIESPAIG